MVSWDITIRFLGLSPNLKELESLAKAEGFSNIEEIRSLGDGLVYLVVNNRGLNQTEFKHEKVDEQ